MNIKIHYIMLAAFLININNQYLFARKIDREVFATLKEESIDNNKFYHYTNIENGVKKEIFKINGQETDKNDYESKLLASELEELKLKRNAELEFLNKKLTLESSVNLKIKKLELKDLISKLEDTIKQANKNNIKKYLNKETKELINQTEEEFLPKIRSFLKANSTTLIQEVGTRIADILSLPFSAILRISPGFSIAQFCATEKWAGLTIEEIHTNSLNTVKCIGKKVGEDVTNIGDSYIIRKGDELIFSGKNKDLVKNLAS